MPPLNGSPQAVALRQAAQAFANCEPSADHHDMAGVRANRRLLSAAISYANACRRCCLCQDGEKKWMCERCRAAVIKFFDRGEVDIGPSSEPTKEG